jgi:hypothetical protein
MSFVSSVIQVAGPLVSAVSLAQVVRGLFSMSALAGFVMMFRPLLTGIARALVLAVRPRLTQEQLVARRKRYDAASLQRGINPAGGGAEALSSRG